ncbi:hypothetical protein L249_4407 [Ophiocordyceps polyrhachis-furcata BCC 54312]|uniref:Uncharacterized protein n=1 Tax=Ophiocordyceps polyrhachis-furcata BCC 54312 TaxID=1330021 RepID=A0A367L838_9HYPO|nr:hypothetical protein L249_4407 [Ophiocordyceps polyrhachis-furcata BCC 54312]
MVPKTLTAISLLGFALTASAAPKKPWLDPDGNACNGSPLSEACLGSDAFCHGEGLKTYGMAYMCLVDRESRSGSSPDATTASPAAAESSSSAPSSLPWLEPNTDMCAFVLNEARLGTKAFCNDDRARRCRGFDTAAACFDAHQPAPPQEKAREEKAPEGLPQEAKGPDEKPEEKPAYGSIPWKQPDRAACTFIENEACLGTEAFCKDEAKRRYGGFGSERECIDAHQPRPKMRMT